MHGRRKPKSEWDDKKRNRRKGIRRNEFDDDEPKQRRCRRMNDSDDDYGFDEKDDE